MLVVVVVGRFVIRMVTGVPFVAQQLTSLSRIHEDAGLIPGLDQ